MAVYQKRSNQLVEVPCDCDASTGGGGSNITLSDAIDSDSSTTGASSKAVKIAYDHASTILNEQIENPDSYFNTNIYEIVKDKVQHVLNSGELDTSISSKVDDNEIRSIKNETNIAKLQTLVSELQTSVLSANESIEANTQDISTNKQDIATNTQDIKTNKQDISINKQDISDLQVSVSNILRQIESLDTSGSSGELASRVARNEDNIVKLQSSLDLITNDISQVKGIASTVQQNSSLLSTINNTTIPDITLKIDNTANELNSLKETINQINLDQLENISQTLGDYDASIKQLNDWNATNVSKISSAQSTANMANALANSNSTLIQTLQETISLLQEEVETLKNSVWGAYTTDESQLETLAQNMPDGSFITVYSG